MRTKKLIILPLVALSFSIGACDSSDKGYVERTNHINPADLYTLTVEGSTSMIIGNVKSGQYQLGRKFSFQMQPVTDVTFYPYLDDVRLEPASYDKYGYPIYEFEIRGNCVLTISSDFFFINKTYTLKEIYPSSGLLTGDTVYKVIIESGTYGTSEENVTTVESFDREDINYNVDVYFNEPFLKDDDFIAPNGGGYTVLKLIMESETCVIELPYGIPCYRTFGAFQYFKYANKSPRKPKIVHPHVEQA